MMYAPWLCHRALHTSAGLCARERVPVHVCAYRVQLNSIGANWAATVEIRRRITQGLRRRSHGLSRLLHHLLSLVQHLLSSITWPVERNEHRTKPFRRTLHKELHDAKPLQL